MRKPKPVYGVPYYSSWTGQTDEHAPDAAQHPLTDSEGNTFGTDPDDFDHLWLTRDGDARAQLYEALRSIDDSYVWKWNIDNRPHGSPSSRASHLEKWQDDDTAVCTTRIPLSDVYDRETRMSPEHPNPRWRPVHQVKTPMESLIFDATETAWKHITRESNEFDDDLANRLHPSAAAWMNVEFSQLNRAQVRTFRWRYPEAGSLKLNTARPVSAGYLLYLPTLGEGPDSARCHWINAFAHAGLETLIWCTLIRVSYRRLLADILAGQVPRIIVACIEYPDDNTRDPEDFHKIPSRIVVNAAKKCGTWFDYGPVHDEEYLHPEGVAGWIESNNPK